MSSKYKYKNKSKIPSKFMLSSTITPPQNSIKPIDPSDTNIPRIHIASDASYTDKKIILTPPSAPIYDAEGRILDSLASQNHLRIRVEQPNEGLSDNFKNFNNTTDIEFDAIKVCEKNKFCLIKVQKSTNIY